MAGNISSRFFRLFFWGMVGLLCGIALYTWRGGDLPWVDEREVREDLEHLAPSAPSPGNNLKYTDLNQCIACLNTFSDTIRDSYARYLAWVEVDQGPQVNAQLVEGLLALPSVQECMRYFGEEEAEPFLGEAYAQALANLGSILGELQGYYESGAYREDQLRKGKRLHKPLMRAFEAYFEQERTTHISLYGYVKSLRDGQVHPKWRSRIRPETDALYDIGAISEEVAFQLGSSLETDQTLLAALDSLEVGLGILQSAASEPEWRQRLSPGLTEFLPALRSWMDSLDERVTRLQSGQTPTPRETMLRTEGIPHLIQGSREKCLVNFRQMATLYNRLTFHTDQLFLLAPILPPL